jgi:hypothetical protein
LARHGHNEQKQQSDEMVFFHCICFRR